MTRSMLPLQLTAWRGKDQVHLRDLLEVGVLDPSWLCRFPPELAARLQHLLDTPGG